MESRGRGCGGDQPWSVGPRRRVKPIVPASLPSVVPDELLHDERQRALVHSWLPGAALVRDHSWGLVGTRVLQVRVGESHYIVKAAGPDDHHLARELRAHREWLAPWTSAGRAPRLVAADPAARVLVTEYLPGHLVQGSAAEWSPDVHRQAGRLLALLHRQDAVEDPDWEARENRRALAWLDRPHRIEPATAVRLAEEVASWPTPPATLVPTHGDWQPRNWLVHGGTTSVIDLGRADLRPAATDLARLAAQQFRADPALEAAFLDGYGVDPREPGRWRRILLREAIGTAVWAYQVGDEAFEQQGRRMIAEALATPPRHARGATAKR